jgi:hypothetical protein
MVDKEALKKAHIDSWEKLRKDLNLGDPFWLEFLKKPEDLVSSLKVKNEPIKNFYNPKNKKLASMIYLDIVNRSVTAYFCGTVIPRKALKRYTENELIMGIFHENLHNVICETTPVFHTIACYWRYACTGEKKYYGEILVAIEDRFAGILARKFGRDFGINSEEASKIVISCIDDLKQIPYIKAIKKLDQREKEFDEIGLKEFIERPLSVAEDVVMKNYGARLNFYDTFAQYEKMMQNAYKRCMNGEWVKIK